MIILDRLAAKTLQDIIDARGSASDSLVENVATKAWGVLQEQGVYAAVLFLLSRPDTERDIANIIVTHLLQLLGHQDLTNLGAAYPNAAITSQWVQRNKQNIFRHFAEGVNGNQGVATDLQRLMAVRSLFERTPIYVRYGAKAL
ncbi:MAG TPA: hypothetical protein VNP04_29570 [Alphaproteobacteria bacterium]|nr:hypothetical protein [Alphaproteobacteria bacterium]